VTASRASALAILAASVAAGVVGQAAPKPASKGAALPARPLETRLSQDEIQTRLAPLVDRLMKAGDVPGLSAAVIRDGAIVWRGSFGVRDAGAPSPVDDDTVFEAASLSKPVFAYSVAKLVDAGKLDLDARLVRYIPGDYAGDPKMALITARHVLSHTTGLPNWRPEGQPLKVHFTPGERFSYSGEGFVYLQKAVERMTGQTLDAWMKRTVFEPLGMTSSSYVWEERFQPVRARGHDSAGEPRPLRRPAVGDAAASLQTTASDYARFLAAALGGVGLTSRTAAEIFRAQIHVDEACQNCVLRTPSGRLSPDVAWGLGWGLEETGDGVAAWHWGDNGSGFHAYVVGYPRQKLGMVVFTNSLGGHGIIPEIVEAAIGGRHPAFAWLDYERYDSPARTLLHEILEKGEPALRAYSERRGTNGSARLTEEQTNRLGYGLLGKKRIPEAISVFEMNTRDFPQSWNVWDSLGEAYATAGQREKAIAAYEKSLALNPKNENGAEALRKMKNEAPAVR
jgi:CubicO group peptidase (beta-lactamase class C family)